RPEQDFTTHRFPFLSRKICRCFSSLGPTIDKQSDGDSQACLQHSTYDGLCVRISATKHKRFCDIFEAIERCDVKRSPQRLHNCTKERKKQRHGESMKIK